MIDLDIRLTKKQAVTLARILADHKDLGWLSRHILEDLELQENNRGPWRKVVGRDKSGLYWYERLECGHHRRLNHSSRRGGQWMEEEADKRRCKRCLLEGKTP